MTTAEKLSQSRNELADALYWLDKMETPTSINVAQVRRKLLPALAKIESVESELSVKEEMERSK